MSRVVAKGSARASNIIPTSNTKHDKKEISYRDDSLTWTWSDDGVDSLVKVPIEYSDNYIFNPGMGIATITDKVYGDCILPSGYFKEYASRVAEKTFKKWKKDGESKNACIKTVGHMLKEDIKNAKADGKKSKRLCSAIQRKRHQSDLCLASGCCFSITIPGAKARRNKKHDYCVMCDAARMARAMDTKQGKATVTHRLCVWLEAGAFVTFEKAAVKIPSEHRKYFYRKLKRIFSLTTEDCRAAREVAKERCVVRAKRKALPIPCKPCKRKARKH